MTDRELLELAAKAAGHRVIEWQKDGTALIESDGCKGGVRWNPLRDRADAFSLMVKLGIQPEFYHNWPSDITVVANLYDESDEWMPGAQEKGPADQAEQLTMRAITRCAAEVVRLSHKHRV